MPRRRLDRIEIQGYKSIAECQLDLGALNILVGPNGAGKSNFISTFGLLGSIVNENLQLAVARAGGASTLLHGGAKRTSLLRLHAHFGELQYEAKLVPRSGDDLIFQSEAIWYSDDTVPEVGLGEAFGSGSRESALPAAAIKQPGGVADECLSTMRRWKVFHFHDTSAQAGLKQKQPIGDNESLRTDASNVAPYLYRLKEADHSRYQRIVDSVRLVAPFFQDFHLRPDPINPERIQLEWRQVDSDAYFNAHALSDGTLRFICLSTLLLQPDSPSLIVIDEPELGLHPFAITQLADLFRAASVDHQLIVSTQSVTLLNQFDVEDIIITEQHHGESSFQRLEVDALQSWLDEYAIGELWEKNVLGGRPY